MGILTQAKKLFVPRRNIVASVEKPSLFIDGKQNLKLAQLAIGGVFTAEHWRAGQMLRRWSWKNLITDVGMNYLLDASFSGGTQITTSYAGLVDNTSFTAFAAADTMGSHAGWIEFEDYDESNRVTWTEGGASARAITNSTAMTFTINANGTLKGAFLTSNNTKGGTTGTLIAEGAFAANYPVAIADEFKLVYTISG